MVSTYLKDMPSWMLQVAEAGVHVWGEKPYAVHSSQLEPVAEAVRRNNLHFRAATRGVFTRLRT